MYFSAIPEQRKPHFFLCQLVGSLVQLEGCNKLVLLYFSYVFNAMINIKESKNGHMPFPVESIKSSNSRKNIFFLSTSENNFLTCLPSLQFT